MITRRNTQHITQRNTRCVARRTLSLLFLAALSVGAVGALGGAGASLTACAGPDKGEMLRKVSTRATPGSFRSAGVSTVYEKRCGSLDCHGDPSRNLRIYSSNGLRLPNDGGFKPGSGETTLDEVTANYQSLMNVEPEITNRVIDGADPNELLIMKKPLYDENLGQGEKHKGGPALKKGDDAERCILSWFNEDALVTPVDKGACARAAIFPNQ